MSYAERMRQFSARFAADQTGEDAVTDELPTQDEWDGLDEHEEHDTLRHSGPRLSG